MARRERAASERRALLAALTQHSLPLDAPRPVSLPQPAPVLQRVPAPAADSAGRVTAAELWAVVHLPTLILDALPSSRQLPCAVVELQSGVQRVIAVDAAARAQGVMPGCSLAVALALCRSLEVRPRAPRRERHLLLQLAEAALSFTPRVSLDLPDALLLEVRGSLALFGGVEALLAALAARTAALGLTSQLALAPTPRAALALSRLGMSPVPVVMNPERLVGVLAPLPLAVLRWPAERLARLESMGVRTIGEALRLPRAGFAKRFGRDALATLDQLVGRVAELRVPFSAREWFRARCEPAYELSEHTTVLRYLQPLLDDLERYLRRRQQAVTELQLRLRHRAAMAVPASTTVVLRLAAAQLDAAALAALLAEHLARVELPAPVIRIELRSGALQPLHAETPSLWRAGEHGGAAGRESTTLIEQLRARLGPDAVYGLCLVPEHRPEKAWAIAEPDLAAPQSLPAVGRHLRRPLWLLRQPEWLQHGLQGLTLLEGPECIETGWWDGGDVTRDYYVARDAAGAQLWIFRERNAPRAWRLQGVFG